jgi:hypothetical protein
MSVDFSAALFYGMPIEGDAGWDLIEVFNESDGPLEVTNLDAYSENDAYMLFVRESHKSGDKRSEPISVRLSDVMGKESEWRQLIADACDKHELAYTEPDWYFATTFS